MSTLCTITGTLRDLSGTLLPNTVIDFVRTGVAGQDGSTVLPKMASATSDGSGVLSITLYAGNYVATVTVAPFSQEVFKVAVPDQATAVLSDLINAAPTAVTPQAVLDAQAAQAASELAADNSATSATESAGSAVSAAASATSAASVVQQDLSALAITVGYTPVDVVVGKMADWSDGGFQMRARERATSWYNETLATGGWLGEAANETAARLVTGAGTGSYYHNTTDGKFYKLNVTSGQTEIFRGGEAGYPAEYAIVAEAARVIIFGASDPALPMWKVWDFTGFTVTSVAMTDGQVIVGTTTGLVVLSLIDDSTDVALAYTTATSPAIVNNSINSVAITVLPNAPIDHATGMPVPTIAVATDGNGTYLASVIQNDGNVYDVAADVSATATSVSFDGPRLTVISGTGTAYVWQDVGAITADGASPDETYTTSSTPALLGTVAQSTPPAFVSSDGLTLLAENLATPANGMAAYMATTYLTGWMQGDIKGAWLCSSEAGDLVGTELVTNGDFPVDTSGWTATGSTPALLTQADGQMTITGQTTTTVHGAYQAFTTVAGQIYTISAEQMLPVAGNRYFYVGTTIGDSSLADLANADFVVGINSMTFTATTTTTYVSLYVYTVGQALIVDNITCRLADPDRSVNNNGLQTFGTITKAPVATGASTMGYSGYSASNYQQQPYNSDLDFGTGDFHVLGWVTTADTWGTLIERKRVTPGGAQIRVEVVTGGYRFQTGAGVILTSTTAPSGAWELVVVLVESGVAKMYINDALDVTNAHTADLSGPDAIVRLGLRVEGVGALDTGSLSRWRFGAGAPSGEQIREAYETEKLLFNEDAVALIYGGSDAILDMSYDATTKLSYILTSAGVSVFSGFIRVSYEAGSWTKIYANDGLVVKL